MFLARPAALFNFIELHWSLAQFAAAGTFTALALRQSMAIVLSPPASKELCSCHLCIHCMLWGGDKNAVRDALCHRLAWWQEVRRVDVDCERWQRLL